MFPLHALTSFVDVSNLSYKPAFESRQLSFMQQNFMVCLRSPLCKRIWTPGEITRVHVSEHIVYTQSVSGARHLTAPRPLAQLYSFIYHLLSKKGVHMHFILCAFASVPSKEWDSSSLEKCLEHNLPRPSCSSWPQPPGSSSRPICRRCRYWCCEWKPFVCSWPQFRACSWGDIRTWGRGRGEVRTCRRGGIWSKSHSCFRDSCSWWWWNQSSSWTSSCSSRSSSWTVVDVAFPYFKFPHRHDGYPPHARCWVATLPMGPEEFFGSLETTKVSGLFLVYALWSCSMFTVRLFRLDSNP